MVSPIAFIAATLGGAFLLGVVRDNWRATSYALTLAVLAFVTLVAGQWVWALSTGAVSAVDVYTAGTEPPFAINLRLGLAEAALVLLINITGLLSALYLKDTMMKQGRRAMAVLLVFSMALSGIVMTRDLFNLFVFFELIVISTGGLILLSRDQRALGAGFKFLMASQVVSILMLVGIIFAYHATGSLNIDHMAAASQQLLKGGVTGILPDLHRGDRRTEGIPRQWLGAGYLRVGPPRLLRPGIGRHRLGGPVCHRQAVADRRPAVDGSRPRSSASSALSAPTCSPWCKRSTAACSAIPRWHRSA